MPTWRSLISWPEDKKLTACNSTKSIYFREKPPKVGRKSVNNPENSLAQAVEIQAKAFVQRGSAVVDNSVDNVNNFGY